MPEEPPKPAEGEEQPSIVDGEKHEGENAELPRETHNEEEEDASMWEETFKTHTDSKPNGKLA